MTELNPAMLPVVLQENPLPVPLERINALVGKAQAALIVTEQDMKAGADLIRMCRAAEKELEEARDKLVRPLNEQVRTINNAFKTLTEPLREGGGRVRRCMEAWQAVMRKKAEEEAARLKKEAEDKALADAARMEEEAARLKANGQDAQAQAVMDQAGHALEEAADAPQAPLAVQSQFRGAFGSVAHTRKTWDFALVDFFKVPRDFLVLDEKHIRDSIAKGTRDIPGLRIYQKETIVTR